MAFNIVTTNTKLEEEGTWVPYPYDEKIEVLLVRFNSKPVQKKFEQLYKVNRKALRSKKLQGEITRQVIAEDILKDWKGLEEDGKPFKYSKENALKLVNDPSAHDFVDWICDESQNLLNFVEGEDLSETAEQLKK